MHVVIIASAKHPIAEPFAGGLESLTWQLIRGLRQRGVQTTVFAGPGSDRGLGAREISVRPLRLSDAARQDVSMVPEAWLQEHHAYLQVMLELQRRDDIDVVHNNSLHHLPVAMAGCLRAPMLTTLHTPPTPWLEPAIALSERTGGWSRYVAVSAHTARAWSHAAAAEVIPNGVDVDRWRPGPGGRDLVWAGRIVPEKAPHVAVEMARAAGRRLRIAGPVGDVPYFAEHIAPRLSHHIEYVGHLGMDDLASLFGSSAATLVTPAWDEPYGLVAAESLACGTPVVALDRGGLREFVTPGVGVLVAGDDLGSAGAAVDWAVTLDRGACRSHAVRHCSVDAMVEDYLATYRSLLRMRGAA